MASLFCIKFNNGEVVFSELESRGTDLYMINPLIIHTGKDGNMSASQWIPYTDDNEFLLPVDCFINISEVSSVFKQFYGSVLMQLEINRIKVDLHDTMQSEKSHISSIELVAKMKDVCSKISSKFGTPIPDFSDYEEAAEKHKPVLH